MRPVAPHFKQVLTQTLHTCMDGKTTDVNRLLTFVPHCPMMFPVMARETFDAEIKTRVPSTVKDHLQAIADDRHLDMADIAREAFREYIARQQAIQPAQPKELAA